MPNPSAITPTQAARRPDFMDALKQCASNLRRMGFDGNRAGFHAVFSDYTAQWSSVDPHGRHVLGHALSYGSCTSFRVNSTCVDEYNRESRLRWSMWLSILPLDMQLNMLLLEMTPQNIAHIDFADIAWEQRSDLLTASDPEKAFRASALGGWCPQGQPGPGSPMATWQKVNDRLKYTMQNVAADLVAHKAWDRLEEWMGLARINACDPLQGSVYVHYNTADYSRCAVYARLRCPLPFWAVGLYTGATEPEFWHAMSKAGGPSAPLLSDSSAPSAAGDQPNGLPDLADPLAWLEPTVFLDEAAIQSVRRTTAAWQHRLLEAQWFGSEKQGPEKQEPKSPTLRRRL